MSHKGHIANLQGTKPNMTLGVQILMMNILAEEPRDGMIKSHGTLHFPLQTHTHFIQVFFTIIKTTRMEVQSVPKYR